MRAVRSHFGVGVFEQVVEVGSDQFISDIDSSKGGDGAGPSPHEYLAASLATCTGMTLAMYSKRKAWDLQDAVVTVDIERSDEVEKFKRTIELFGNLDTEQRERLLEIANKCPVHKALAGKIQINTALL